MKCRALLFAKASEKPLYAFARALSCASFAYSNRSNDGGGTIATVFTVTSTGVPRMCWRTTTLSRRSRGGKRLRLLGFEGVVLKSGESTGREAERGSRGRWRASTRTPARGASPKALTGGVYWAAPGKSAYAFELLQTLRGRDVSLGSNDIASIFCTAWLRSPAQYRQPARHVEQCHQGGGNIGPCRGAEQATGMRQVAIDQITPPLQKR